MRPQENGPEATQVLLSTTGYLSVLVLGMPGEAQAPGKLPRGFSSTSAYYWVLVCTSPGHALRGPGPGRAAQRLFKYFCVLLGSSLY